MDAIIVGNSAKLLKARQGDFIDSHETIIRLNGGIPSPTTYSSIGRKTHYWSMSANERQYTLWEKEWSKLPKIMFLNGRSRWTPEGAMVWDEDNYKAFIEDFGYERPSTGLITAQHIRKVLGWDLTAIGFDGFQSQTWYRKSDQHGPHNGKQELDYMKKLGVKIL